MRTSVSCRVVILGMMLAGWIGLRPTQAATFNVADGDVAALTNAIDSANLAGGTNTIVLATNGVYTISARNNFWYGPNGLPPISSRLIIEGNGATITRDTNAATFRLFYISGGATNHLAAGNLTLREVVLVNGQAKGGNAGDLGGGGAGLGGAIFNQGTLIIEDSTLTNNIARGGAGGGSGLGGGGGGLGGNGGTGSNGGGGGGGFGGNGGNGSNGGGGGGSFSGNGGNGSNGGGGGAGFNSNGSGGSNGGGGGGGLDGSGGSAGNDGGAGGGVNGGAGGVQPGIGDFDGGAGSPGGAFSGGGGGSLSGICTNSDFFTCNSNGGDGGDGGSYGGGGGGGLGDGGDGGTGGDGGIYGGGGGGGLKGLNGDDSIGGSGGLGGGGGGGSLGTGGNGGIGGGGGGSGNSGPVGGAGGFGGGGGGGDGGTGGVGGFGGGGGGVDGAGGFGGGNGASSAGAGGGGIGGAIFSDSGATLIVSNSTIVANTAQGGDAGSGADGGSGIGGGIFSMDCSPNIVGSVVTNNTVIGSFSSDTNVGSFETDETRPVITCPSAIVSDATTNTGAVVEFDAPTATDNCDSDPDVSSTPASGSLFAFGTTIVTNTATDIAGNTTNCTFSITVLEPREVVQDVLDDIAGLTNSVPTKPDGRALAGALKQLNAGDLTNVWDDSSHPDPKAGRKAFIKVRSAIIKLLALKRKADKTVTDEDLDEFVDRLVNATRVLAENAIAEAVGAGADAAKVAKANAALAKGDAETNLKRAVSHYRTAWRTAVRATPGSI